MLVAIELWETRNGPRMEKCRCLYSPCPSPSRNRATWSGSATRDTIICCQTLGKSPDSSTGHDGGGRRAKQYRMMMEVGRVTSHQRLSARRPTRTRATLAKAVIGLPRTALRDDDIKAYAFIRTSGIRIMRGASKQGLLLMRSSGYGKRRRSSARATPVILPPSHVGILQVAVEPDAHVGLAHHEHRDVLLELITCLKLQQSHRNTHRGNESVLEVYVLTKCARRSK